MIAFYAELVICQCPVSRYNSSTAVGCLEILILSTMLVPASPTLLKMLMDAHQLLVINQWPANLFPYGSFLKPGVYLLHSNRYIRCCNILCYSKCVYLLSVWDLPLRMVKCGFSPVLLSYEIPSCFIKISRSGILLSTLSMGSGVSSDGPSS